MIKREKEMTKEEEEELLLIDLCARLPYGLKCHIGYTFNNETTDGKDVYTEDDDTITEVNIFLGTVHADYLGECFDIDQIKPYLRPMSSMTKEEKKVYIEISSNLCGEIAAKTMIDWLNKYHFDYRGLISKGLALEATEGMYKEYEKV